VERRTAHTAQAQSAAHHGRGELVDNALVEAIVRQRLQDHDWNYGFIIDAARRARRVLPRGCTSMP
jgi:adenylate kinase family enzyme